MVLTKERPAVKWSGRSKKTSRQKAVQVKMPVPMNELPEYKDALRWTESVRAEAEKRIARETNEVSGGVLKRLDGLVGSGINRRQRDAVTLWNGTPAHGRQPGSGDFSSIEYLMKGISLLPVDGENVALWWRRQADDSVTDHDEQVFFLMFVDGHRACTSDSAILLRDCMRAAIASLLPDIPGAVQLTRMLLAEQTALPEAARRAVALSEIVLILNEMEWRRDRTESDSREHTGKRYDVEEVLAALRAAGITEVVVDCGQVRNAAQMREAIEEFGARVRGCKSCQNWFAVEEKNVPYHWYDRCPGCVSHGFRGVVFGGHNYESREEQLTSIVRRRTEATIDVRVHLALAEQTTIAHAGRMLLNDTEAVGVDAVKAETERLEPCPIAASCKSACGVMQDKGLRPVPITPVDGKFEFCQLFAYRRMVEGIADQEVRDRVALEWIREMMDDERAGAKRQAEMFEHIASHDDVDETEAADGTTVPGPVDTGTADARPAEVKVQATLF
ncbi:MAG: hypothetical protein OXD31_17130 [Chloroflexi bacterium]|nr:hypothetical protein [Chloroflexota bacterium]